MPAPNAASARNAANSTVTPSTPSDGSGHPRGGGCERDEQHHHGHADQGTAHAPHDEPRLAGTEHRAEGVSHAGDEPRRRVDDADEPHQTGADLGGGRELQLGRYHLVEPGQQIADRVDQILLGRLRLLLEHDAHDREQQQQRREREEGTVGQRAGFHTQLIALHAIGEARRGPDDEASESRVAAPQGIDPGPDTLGERSRLSRRNPSSRPVDPHFDDHRRSLLDRRLRLVLRELLVEQGAITRELEPGIDHVSLTVGDHLLQLGPILVVLVELIATSGLASMLRIFCVSVSLANTSLSRSSTAEIGTTCGRPSG